MKNPYPEKIFPPIEEEEWRRIDELLRKELGFPLDRVSGNIGRIVWNNLMEDVKSAVQGFIKEVKFYTDEDGDCLLPTDEIIELVKKWFADVINKEEER